MKFGEQVHFVCPFCAGPASVARIERIDDGDDVPAEMLGQVAAVHAEPRCVPFETMDASDFLEAATTRQRLIQSQTRGVA